jgi:hypothetical protein
MEVAGISEYQCMIGSKNGRRSTVFLVAAQPPMTSSPRSQMKTWKSFPNCGYQFSVIKMIKDWQWWEILSLECMP